MPYADPIKRKEAHKIYSRQHYEKNKAQIMARTRVSNKAHIERNQLFICDYLKDKKCEGCGNKNGVVLTFDHLRDKFMEVSQMAKASYSITAIKAEIAKCRILCYNCHMIYRNREINSIKWRYFNGDDSARKSSNDPFVSPQFVAHNTALSSG